MKRLEIEIPSGANEIIHSLQNNGYEAFLVGGCVRDSILGRPIHDYDITTSATPRADIKAQAYTEQRSRLQKIGNIEYILEEVLQKDECFSLKDLAVNGNDLIEIGYKPGKEIGNTLNCLLQLVIEGVYLNEKSELLKYVETTKEWMKLGENYNGEII